MESCHFIIDLHVVFAQVKMCQVEIDTKQFWELKIIPTGIGRASIRMLLGLFASGGSGLGYCGWDTLVAVATQSLYTGHMVPAGSHLGGGLVFLEYEMER